MNNLKKQYKNKFDEVELSNEREYYLKDKIINGYKKKQRTKKVLCSLVVIFGIVILGTGIAYADEIKVKLNKLITYKYDKKTSNGTNYEEYHIESDAIKELNYDANLEGPKCTKLLDNYSEVAVDDECYTLYTYEELEKELDIKLLKSDLFVSNNFIIRNLNRDGGKIASMEIWLINPLNAKNNSSEKTRLTMRIFIRTKYLEIKGNSLWETNIFPDEEEHDYYIKKLKTTAYGTELGNTNRFVFLTYDDVVYRFDIKVGGENVKEPDNEVQRILDSLYY